MADPLIDIINPTKKPNTKVTPQRQNPIKETVFNAYDDQGNPIGNVTVKGNPKASTLSGKTAYVTSDGSLSLDASKAANNIPKIVLSGNNIKLTGSKAALNSVAADTIRQAINNDIISKGVKTTDANISDYVNSINETIANSVKEAGGAGTTVGKAYLGLNGKSIEENRDWLNAAQVVSSENPNKSTTKIRGINPFTNKIESKTYSQWIEEFRKNNLSDTETRANFYKWSAGQEGYNNLPFLLMSQGKGAEPIEGFTAEERRGVLGKSFGNEVARSWQGIARHAADVVDMRSWTDPERRKRLDQELERERRKLDQSNEAMSVYAPTETKIGSIGGTIGGIITNPEALAANMLLTAATAGVGNAIAGTTVAARIAANAPRLARIASVGFRGATGAAKLSRANSLGRNIGIIGGALAREMREDLVASAIDTAATDRDTFSENLTPQGFLENMVGNAVFLGGAKVVGKGLRALGNAINTRTTSVRGSADGIPLADLGVTENVSAQADNIDIDAINKVAQQYTDAKNAIQNGQLESIDVSTGNPTISVNGESRVLDKVVLTTDNIRLIDRAPQSVINAVDLSARSRASSPNIRLSENVRRILNSDPLTTASPNRTAASQDIIGGRIDIPKGADSYEYIENASMAAVKRIKDNADPNETVKFIEALDNAADRLAAANAKTAEEREIISLASVENGNEMKDPIDPFYESKNIDERYNVLFEKYGDSLDAAFVEELAKNNLIDVRYISPDETPTKTTASSSRVTADKPGKIDKVAVADNKAIETFAIENSPNSSSPDYTTDNVRYNFNNYAEAIDAKNTIDLANVQAWKDGVTDLARREFDANVMPAIQSFADSNGISVEDVMKKLYELDYLTAKKLDTTHLDVYKQLWQSALEPYFSPLNRMGADGLGVQPFMRDYYMPGFYGENITGALTSRGGNRMTKTYSLLQDDSGAFTTAKVSLDPDAVGERYARQMVEDASGDLSALRNILNDAALEGQDITPQQAKQTKLELDAIEKTVTDEQATKELEKVFAEDSDEITTVSEQIEAETEKGKKGKKKTKKRELTQEEFNAKMDAIRKEMTSGGERANLVDKIHNAYANNGWYSAQAPVTGNITGGKNFLTQNQNVIEMIKSSKGTIGDWGARDLLTGEANAKEIMVRVRNGESLRSVLEDYAQEHGHMKPEAASHWADNVVGKVSELPTLPNGNVDFALAQAQVGHATHNLATNTLKKWVAMTDVSQLSPSSKKFLNNLLFQQISFDQVKNSEKVRKGFSDAVNVLMGARHRALMWGNLKNAQLQLTDIQNFFSMNKMGDVKDTIKDLATNQAFRDEVSDWHYILTNKISTYDNDSINQYSKLAQFMRKNKAGEIVYDTVKGVDEAALGGINVAEDTKNRIIIAGILKSGQNQGLTGEDLSRYVRSRYYREALAINGMGRLNVANSPTGRMLTMYMNFPIRTFQLFGQNMGLLNPMDMTGVPEKKLAYLAKWAGLKAVIYAIEAKFGYDLLTVLGADPFGLLSEDYTGIDDEDKTVVDYFMDKNPLFAGAMTSAISDFYFFLRRGYEDAQTETEASGEDWFDSTKNKNWIGGLRFPEITSEDLWGTAAGWVPGGGMGRRISQMNELLDRGYGVSGAGNVMYQAPEDAGNIIAGYLLGRNNTANARNYFQASDPIQGLIEGGLPGLGRSIARDSSVQNITDMINRTNTYRRFDPLDVENFSDWFDGSYNDRANFNTGVWAFQEEVKNLIDSAEDNMNYRNAEEMRNALGERLNEIWERVDRFVDAYEEKNGSIDGNQMQRLQRVFSTFSESPRFTAEQNREQSLRDYNNQAERYSQYGLPAVGRWKTTDDSDVAQFEFSPQVRNALQGRYGAPKEAISVLKTADKELKELRDQIKEEYFAAMKRKDYDTVQAIQEAYLEEFDRVVAPIIQAYGNQILGTTAVTDQIEHMLSFGTVKTKAGLIPTEQYQKNKRGRFQSMPNMKVDVQKWAQNRYNGAEFSRPTLNYSQDSKSLIDEIRSEERTNPASAKAKARAFIQRVSDGRAYANRSDLNYLKNLLK